MHLNRRNALRTGEPLEFKADGYTFSPFHLGNRDPYHLYWRRR